MADHDLTKALFRNDFYGQFISRGVRPDGRELHAIRDTAIAVGNLSRAYGSSLVKIGRTVAIAGVMIQIGQPLTSCPGKGGIDFSVTMSPLCAPKFAIGKAPEEAQALGEFITRVVVGSKAIQLEDLCIEEGKAAWMLHVDVVILDHSGNAVDAALIASVAALANTRLPTAVPSPGGGDALGSCEMAISRDRTTSLELAHLPLPLTFGIASFLTTPAASERVEPEMEESETAPTRMSVATSLQRAKARSRTFVLIADPDVEEERVLADEAGNSSGYVTIVGNEAGQRSMAFCVSYVEQICGVYKPGGAALSSDHLASAMTLAQARAKALGATIRRAISLQAA